jgi:hypothetical protein
VHGLRCGGANDHVAVGSPGTQGVLLSSAPKVLSPPLEQMPRVLRKDILAFLSELEPGARYNAYVAVRSLYRWATRRGNVAEDLSSAIPRPRLVSRDPRPVP